MRRLTLAVVVLAVGAIEAVSAGSPSATEVVRCRAIAAEALEGGEIIGAELIPEQRFNADHPQSPVAPVPSHCRVDAVLRPGADSKIRIQIWLPASQWNGRFLGVGNGGYAGTFNLPEVATAVQRGYAAATTDTGHGDVGTEAWANHPEKLVDFAHRAIHLTAVAGKHIAARFYGKAPHHSYFSACSNGGRQGLMQAARYPEDYDGIIAGAPAADWTGLFVASFGWISKVLRESPISADKVPALEKAVLAQCDALDHAADGLLLNPAECRFDPSPLRCSGREDQSCFTDEQIAALGKIYRGPTTPDGRQLYPGLSPGGELSAGDSPGWDLWILNSPGRPPIYYGFFQSFMRDFVTRDPNWKLEHLDLARDYAAAEESLAPLLNADYPDLSAFAQRGGKLILYHGWSDAVIPPLATIHYYDSVRRTMGEAATSSFSRLYMVPGMHHCAMGPGPWAFNPSAARKDAAAQTDMAAALERWVEDGIAPQQLQAIRPSHPSSVFVGFPQLKVERSGLLCPYPQIARYDGKGNPTSASSYACAAPDEP